MMSGCQQMGGPLKYSIAIKNGTVQPVDKTDVRFAKFSSGGGCLCPGIKKTYELVPYPIPEKATVFWQSADGKSYEKVVDVLKNLPKGFNEGDIIFTILEDEKVIVTNNPYLKLPKNWR